VSDVAFPGELPDRSHQKARPTAEASPLKILSIAHAGVSRDAGRLRYRPLAARCDLSVHLVVPARWHQFGRKLVADPPNENVGLTVYALPIRLPRVGRAGWYLHFYPALRRLITTIRPDVIHLWEEPWSVVALQACLLKGTAALVLEVDQNILKRLPPPFEAVRRYVQRQTDHMLSRSSDATKVLRATGYTGPVTPIGYGVDQRTFWPASELENPGTARSGLKIGYVGRLVEEKGIDDALEALTLTASYVSLAIMGEGPHESRLRRRVAELQIADRVVFRKWGEPSDVADFLRGLDVLVLLTRTTRDVREQFGRVIIEAQACGVPVIGSESGAIPNVIGDGGWVVPERDPQALARLLDHIVSDADGRKSRSIAAQRNVASRFTYEVVSDALASAWITASVRKTRGHPGRELV
jgi:glycosyltransferase involved in cell wall biosynthesis